MISPKIERFLLEQEDTFLTPADKLAVIIDSHNIDHAKLLLSHMTFSRVPVVTEDNHFVGTIGLNDIVQYQVGQELSDDELQQDIALITKRDVTTVRENYELADVLRKLIDESFLPVLGEGDEFLGIITRKSILKAVNALVHSFDIVEKNK
ncbi:CBS domain-containing protein [Streptococcus minor]|uniref:CBS domain-containing protein n=1 Tax=Streptococcus minor TaxID=229549 RepID=A0A3P1VDH6_9STRE|nr:cyclic-di-AMP-binding protein CbpB [Streptococcus minor]MDO5078210.1 cyclic-di-AMP-binding protein CbpB [Streptococcus minor]RRD31818.1 CBS domain-containing protein [Streptococcus minor]